MNFFTKKQREELMTKYCDLYGATLMNLINQVGAEHVVDCNILRRTKSIMETAIQKPQDIVYFHKKLMKMREA